MSAPAVAPSKELLERLYRSGVKHYAAGEYLQATTIFLRIAALDPGNAELQAIDEFKLSFGGRRVTEYWGVETRTLKGWIALSWFRWRGRGD